uniref:Uncharacterized protein n=1 Tax=Escherichia coli TaxID=562 RepID=A0A7U1E1A0_ECOLX|nr:hypothetical protein [Escherichia coli]
MLMLQATNCHPARFPLQRQFSPSHLKYMPTPKDKLLS